MPSLDSYSHQPSQSSSPRNLLLPFFVAVLQGCASAPTTRQPASLAEQYERRNQSEDALQNRAQNQRIALASPELVASRIQTLQSRLQAEVVPFFVLYHLTPLVQEHQSTYNPDRYDSSDERIADQALAIIEAHLDQKLTEWHGLPAEEIDTRFAAEERRVTTAISSAYNTLNGISAEYRRIEGDIFNSIPFADPAQRNEIPQIVRLRQAGHYYRIELMLRIMSRMSYSHWHVVHGVMASGTPPSHQ